MNPNKDSAIHLKDVSFSYSGSVNQTVLNIPSWQVTNGEHVFIVGDSGSGKSTLLKLLSGVLSPNRGTISVAGHSLETLSNRQRDCFRATHIGYVSQDFNLIPYFSAIDNIKLAHYFAHHPKQTGKTIDFESLLLELNIAQSQWQKPVHHLSIGQQQRVAIARAMINKPGLLIADEPTSSLDQSNRDTFISLLMDTANLHDTTLIFVSHDLSLSRHFQRVDTMSKINSSEV